MAGTIKGITIEIDGNTTKLSQALSGVNKSLNSTQSELRQVEKLLKLDPKNTELLAQKQQLLTKAIDETKQKLATLKEAKRQLDQQFKQTGTRNEEQYRALTREIAKTELSLKSLTTSQKTASTSTSRLATTLANLKVGVMIAWQVFLRLARVITNFGKKAIETASSLEEVQNVVDTTFSTSSDEVNAWAKTTAETFGISELKAKEYVGTMGAMLKSMGLTEQQAKDMGTSMVGLAGDIASFYNIDSEEAFEKIRSGIAGQSKPLKELGINLDATTMSEYALEQGITKSWNAMTQSEKATLRYAYLMEVTKDIQGDFAKTSESFANQQRILQLQFESLAGVIGAAFLPSMTSALKLFKDFLKDFREAFESGGFEGLFNSIGQAFGKSLSSLISNLPSFMSTLVGSLVNLFIGAFNSLGAELPKIIPNIVRTITDTIASIFDNAGSAALSAVNLVSGLAIGIANGIPEIVKQIPKLIASFTGGILNSLPQILKAGSNVIMNLINGLMLAIPLIAEAIPEIINTLVNGLIVSLPQIIEQGTNIIASLLDGIYVTLPNLVEQIPIILTEIATALLNNLPTILSAGGEILLALIKGIIKLLPRLSLIPGTIINLLVHGLKGLLSAIVNIGVDIVKGIWQGIKNTANWLTNKIGGWAKSVVKDVKDFFGIHSPSRVMADSIGKPLSQGVAQGILNGMGAINNAMKQIDTAVTQSINPTINPVSSGGNNVNLTVYAQTLDNEQINNLVNVLNVKLGGAY